LIVKNDNGVVNLNEMAIIIENNELNHYSTLFFQISLLEIPRIPWKFLKHVD